MDIANLYANIRHLFQFDLKEEQKTILDVLLRKRTDVSAVLPTGFGKSMCYVLPPLLLDQYAPDVKHVSLVISPLLSLMEDQRGQLENRNIKAIVISHKTKLEANAVVNTEASVIFTTPECLQNQQWRKVFLNQMFQKRLCVFAVDEAHCVSEWGEEFRPEYRMMSSVRSLIDVPFLALTATATMAVQDDIMNYLALDEDTLTSVAVVPNRPNICLVINDGCTQNYSEELAWLVTYLMETDSEQWHKTVIFCRSYAAVYSIWSWLVEVAGEKGFKQNVRTIVNKRIELFHGSTDEDSKERIIKEITGTNSTIRILVSTVAFGMGIDINDIDVVIHWGAPKSTLSYWQEVGRAGRPGQKCIAVMYPYKRSLLKTVTGNDIRRLLEKNNVFGTKF